MSKAVFPKYPTLTGKPNALTFPEGYTTTSSYRRAQVEPLKSNPINDHEIMVRLGEGSHHRVAFYVEDGNLKGHCSCKGWNYRDWCAHVAALWWEWCNGDLHVRDTDADQTLARPPAWLSVEDREVIA